MDKKLRRFFTGSIISALVVCLVVFIFLTLFMSSQTEKSVANISHTYMEEMNLQLEQKFISIVGLRLEQVEGIVKRVQPGSAKYGQKMRDDLLTSGEVRNFTYLGLYTDKGEAERIIGEKIEISKFENLVAQLKKTDKQAVAVAVNEAEERYLILAVSAEYPLKNGSKSTALIAGVPMQYLNDALFLSDKYGSMYSHVIDREGNFVIRNGDAYRENYFDRIGSMVEEKDGKTAAEQKEEMKKAIAAGKVYSTEVIVDGEIRHLFCSPVSKDKVDWYWTSVMTNSTLNEQISKLDFMRVVFTLSSCSIILLTMMVIFIIYYNLSKKQLRETDKAKQEAVRANMAKSEFLSSMSHDIRTPMNAIIGMTEIALKNPHDFMRVEDCLRKVKLSSKQLLGLINDVLDMSKIESGKMTLSAAPTSLREVMDDIVNIAQPQVKAKDQFFDIFIYKIESEMVYCDEVRLNQVLLNLLSNALKFTPEKGRIDIHCYQEPSSKGDEYVQTHFIVEDTGIGMSEEFQKKIFDSFEREDNEQVRHINGTGLGTSITKSIIMLMGGTIELTSEKGKGSKFHVIVDLKRAEEEDSDMSLPEWNVLVVDDNEQLCTSAVFNLEELGVHAEYTMDGQKAVEMIEERHRNNDDYHFVLIDWKMPNMDGIQTIREIRSRVGKGIPVFLVSAYDWGDIGEEFQNSDIEGFIAKPLFKSTLYTHLKQYINGKSDEVSPQKEEIDFEGRHILLAEDIDINWEIANEILSSVGLVMERAVNGLECVETFEKSEVGYYDAILMDVRMPIMNGYEATRTIRALEREDSTLPIIAMTADAFSDDAQRCFESGMDAHLTKPLDIKECMRTLQKFLK